MEETTRVAQLSRYSALLLIGVATLFAAFFFSVKPAFAAAPTGTSADVQNGATTASVKLIVTGTNYSTFVHSTTSTADSTDLLGITYRSTNPTSATVTNATTLTLVFPIAIGSDKSGSLTIAADTVQDGSSVHNLLITIVNGSITDHAGPVLTSSTPANGAAGVAKSATITLVFSEPIASITDSVNTGVTLTNSTTLPAATVVLTSTKPSGTNIVTISTAPDAGANAFVGAGASAANPFTFYVTADNSTSAPIQTISNDVNIEAPLAGSSFASGSTVSISWDSGAGVGSVNISYSLDDGLTYTSLATGLGPNGTYAWIAPSVSGTVDASIQIEGMDASTVITTAISGSFTIVGSSESSSDDSSDDSSSDDSADVTSNSSVAGTTGTNPFTGASEIISSVSVGDCIVSPSASTVYYVDTGLVRRPFMDYQSYQTYALTGGASITVVTDATMPTLPLGALMLPKAGVVLVKIQSDNHVYATSTDGDGNTVLHWVASETIANELYGATWANYVIDLQPTVFAKFTVGSDYNGTESLDTSMMKTRSQVNS